MCGFFGHIKKNSDSRLAEVFQSLRTVDFIKRRGPDDQQQLSLDNAFFYHSRLSLMGSFSKGIQPYRGRFPNDDSAILLFNGSIYNYKSLNNSAESDTEVLYNLCLDKPIDLSSVNGAFSFSLYRPRERSLELYRDRIGIRTLFYVGLDANGSITDGRADEIIYSTNLLPLVEMLRKRGLNIEEDSNSLLEYNSFRFIRETSKTFFKGIKQLSPGHHISWSCGEVIEQKCYWSLEGKRQKNDFKPLLSEEEFAEQAHYLLKDSIVIRGESSSPISSFLSGGLDSGLVTSVGLESGFVKKSFHLSLPGETNELGRFKSFMQEYPHEFEVIDFKRPSELDQKNILLRLEQPIGDSIVFLIDQLFEKCSEEFKIAMSGDGADELFGGYIHHRLFQLVQIFHRIFPGVVRESLISLLLKMPIGFFNFFFPYNDQLDQKGVIKLVSFLRKFSRPFYAYAYLVSLADIDEDSQLLEGIQPYWQSMEQKDFRIEELLAFDLKYWGPGYSLFKIDRLSYQHGLEVRTPFYDHRLVELCMSQSFMSNLNILRAKWSLQKFSKGLVSRKTIGQAKFPFRVKDHFLKKDGALLKDKGVLEAKKATCYANYENWKKGVEKLIV